jgi:PAS domain S-box-containing protein
MAQPKVGIVKALCSTNTNGAIVRRMMTAAFICPPMLGWLGLLSVEQGLLSSSTAWALVALVGVILFASFVWQSSDAMGAYEEEISKSELRFRSMANSIPQMAWMADPSGNLYWYNQRWYDYTGTKIEEMQRWGWTSVHNEEALPQTLSKWEAALQSGEPWEDVLQIKGKDENFRWFLSRAMPLKNERGEITNWFGSHTDIDDQRKFEADLKQSQERYETLTGAIPQLVWTCLPDGRCNYLSKQWVEYTGVPEQNQLGLQWLDRVIHPDDRDRTRQHWVGAVRGLHSYDIEYRILRFDGEYRWFKARGTAMRNAEGEVLSWVGTCTDVHDQKLAAEEFLEAKLVAERASQAKTQFLANVSHEIRTPINAIMGFADLLKTSRIPTKDKEIFTHIIERNSHNLLRLIDDILDLSKVEAGKIEIENTIFSLPDFLSDFYSANSLRAAEKGILFVLKFDSEIPDRISTDQLRLRQILSNIVGNAIKFTAQGEVELRVRYQNQNLVFVVNDTGPGISIENRERLFQPFSQADPTFTRKYGGTGLGLILSKRLSQLLGGDLVLLSSEPNVGSSFSAKIYPAPVANAALVGINSLSVSRRSTAENSEQKKLLEGLNVLLVEDSPDNRMLISMYLKKTGAQIEIAEDGLDGFEKAMASVPDVVLMDIQMPKLDGHSAMRKLRAAGFSKPIIALTAHAMREERDKCIESGCTDYLTKPIQRDRLIEVLVRYLP